MTAKPKTMPDEVYIQQQHNHCGWGVIAAEWYSLEGYSRYVRADLAQPVSTDQNLEIAIGNLLRSTNEAIAANIESGAPDCDPERRKIL